MERVLQGKINRLLEIGRCYGIEINVEKNKGNENLETAISNTNCDGKQQGNMEYFNYFGSITTTWVA
jgi:hypothetical protein